MKLGILKQAIVQGFTSTIVTFIIGYALSLYSGELQMISSSALLFVIMFPALVALSYWTIVAFETTDK